MTTLDDIVKVAGSQTVWAVLFIITLYIVYKAVIKYIDDLQRKNKEREEVIFELYETHKQESTKREERLMAHLERTTQSLELLNRDINYLGARIDEGFHDVWRTLNKIKTRSEDENE